MQWLLKVLLGVSLVFNALFIYRDFMDHPDIDFFGHSRKDAYLIKKQLGGDYFLIEHWNPSDEKLHEYTAKCQPTLTWLKGIVNPGRPMSDSCTYLPGYVGKTIAAGLMRKENDTIVFTGWANDDTVQTADVLTIVRDEVTK